MKRVLRFPMLLGMALFQTDVSFAQSVFEQKIADSSPCSGVRFDKGLVEIRVDRVKSVRIDEFGIVLRGDVIAASLLGALSCRTSDAAVFKGDIGADLAVTAKVAIPGCTLSSIDVVLSNFSGTFAVALEVFGSEAENAIKAAVQDRIVEACRGLVEGLAK